MIVHPSVNQLISQFINQCVPGLCSDIRAPHSDHQSISQFINQCVPGLCSDDRAPRSDHLAGVLLLGTQLCADRDPGAAVSRRC